MIEPTESRPEVQQVALEPSRFWLYRHRWGITFWTLIFASIVLAVVSGYTNVVGYSSVINLIALAIIRLFPARLTIHNPQAEKSREQLWREVRPILIYALLYPIVMIPTIIWTKFQPLYLLPGWDRDWAFTWNYGVVTKIVLLGLPTLFLLYRYGGTTVQLGITGIRSVWRWLGPLMLLLFYVLWLAPSLFPGPQTRNVPFGIAFLVWLFIFIMAGFPEEYFYRVLLQTRLELLLGRWNGLYVATFLFGLMHFTSRYALIWLGTSFSPLLDAGLTLTAILTGQTITGLVLAYLWLRYRNAWLNVLFHTAFDALITIGAIMHVRGMF